MNASIFLVLCMFVEHLRMHVYSMEHDAAQNMCLKSLHRSFVQHHLNMFVFRCRPTSDHHTHLQTSRPFPHRRNAKTGRCSILVDYRHPNGFYAKQPATLPHSHAHAQFLEREEPRRACIAKYVKKMLASMRVAGIR